MIYLSQKIKSLETIKVSNKLHRSIMRRVLFLHFRKFKEPFLVLALLAILGLIADTLNFIRHSNVFLVIQTLLLDFQWKLASFTKISIIIFTKSINHLDFAIVLFVNMFLVIYLLHLFVRFDKEKYGLNIFTWGYKSFIRLIKVALNQTLRGLKYPLHTKNPLS